MENQHRQISGYRELTKAEIDLMNEVKALGPQIEAVLLKVQAHVAAQEVAAYNQVEAGWQDNEVDAAGKTELKRLQDATPERFIALAKTELQTGLMYLTRAVAQPTFF